MYSLAALGEPASPEQVLESMIRFGIDPDTADPLQTVRIHLGRSVARGEAMKFRGRRFGLPAWAPER